MKVDQSADALVIETPPGGFNSVSAFPLLLGGLFATLGVLCLVSARTRDDRQSLAIAVPALLVGGWVGRLGVRVALRRHRIEVNRTRVRISSWGGGNRTVVECPARDVRVALRSGRAWEVGLLPQWHQWQKQFVRLSIECGGCELFLLDGAPDRDKETAREILHQWLT